MSDAFFDKFIADLVKGAEVNSRSVGGPGVNIVIDRENHGREEKIAVDFGYHPGRGIRRTHRCRTSVGGTRQHGGALERWAVAGCRPWSSRFGAQP